MLISAGQCQDVGRRTCIGASKLQYWDRLTNIIFLTIVNLLIYQRFPICSFIYLSSVVKPEHLISASVVFVYPNYEMLLSSQWSTHVVLCSLILFDSNPCHGYDL